MRFDWEWKPGLGPRRPVLHAQAEGELSQAAEENRSGQGGALRVSVRQRLDESWRVVVGREWRRFDAKSVAFDHSACTSFFRLERSFGEQWTLDLELGWRKGDVVSYSRPPRPDLVALGKPITTVPTFEQEEPWLAYYFPATTRIFEVALHRAFRRGSFSLGYAHRATTHAGPGYRNRITTVQWIAPF